MEAKANQETKVQKRSSPAGETEDRNRRRNSEQSEHLLMKTETAAAILLEPLGPQITRTCQIETRRKKAGKVFSY